MPGHSIREVAKVCAALKLLQTGCGLEILSLKLDAPLCKLQVEPLPLPFKRGFFKFVDDLAAIATTFRVNLIMPDTLEMTRDAEETLLMLRAFALGEPLELDGFRNSLIKSAENATLVPQQFSEEIAFRMEHENATAMLFGTPIRLGPTAIHVGRAEVVKFSETMQRFAKAKMGTSVPIALRPLMPVHFDLIERKALLSSGS